MSSRLDPPPEAVEILAQRCVTHVCRRVGFELDYTHETLGALDHFVRLVVADEGGGAVSRPGHPARAHLVPLLAPTIGAYFGEVVRRAYPCRWRFLGEDPRDWVLEFEDVMLRFGPVGAAAEALVEVAVDGWRGEFVTAPEDAAPLFERLAQAPPLPENEFFALASRFDVLQLVEDWLQCRQVLEQREPAAYGPADYDLVFPPTA